MENCKDFFEFQVRRNSTRLSRGLLVLLEDLKAQQDMRQEQLLKLLPPEHHNTIRVSNVLTDEQMKHLRKRILDNTNDYARDILTDLENYEIEFNFKKEGR